MAVLLKLEEPAQGSGNEHGFALWALGFRPFYLLASVHAAVSILLWGMQFAGWFPYAYLQGPIWHAHEMLFGFVLPVMVGFLLTAGQAWTGRKTLNGYPLMLLVLLWLVARVLVLTPWGWAAAIANVAFPWAAAVALAVPFVKAGARRNYFFPVLLGLLGVASLGVHASSLGLVLLPRWVGVQLALDIVLFIMVVMAGRVIPPFTSNGVPGSNPQRLPWLEKLAPGLILVVLVADALQLEGVSMTAVLIAATLAHGWRLSLWQSIKTICTPLVGVLHLAYGWIVLHLALRVLQEIGGLGLHVATHALTAGAMGTLIIGMMTRTARGHTGRPLRADHFDVACYLLVTAGAVVRVFVPLVMPVWFLQTVIVSAILWSMAFALYAIRYWPVLTRARLDGKPG
jgi:uncharacterized protein involved in response to NO